MKIDSFKELLNEIMWSWDYPNYDFKYDEINNTYLLNKLTIKPEKATYKTNVYELEPGIFEQVKTFYEFLKSTEKK